MNVKCWAVEKAMEFLYSSYETTFKDEVTKAFVPLSIALTYSSDETNSTSTRSNIQNTSVELGESALQLDEAQSSKNSITSDNLQIPTLGGFNSIIAKPIEDKNIIKVATLPLLPGPASIYDAIYTALK